MTVVSRVRRMLRVRPSPSLAVGFTALLVALGGTSYAVVLIPINSVGSAQIKSNGVASSDIRPNAVTSAKVQNGKLLAVDFAAGELPAGPVGSPGVAGAPGAQGPQGPAGIATVSSVNGSPVSVAPGDVGSASATCPVGSALVGTGFSASVGSVGFVERFGNTAGMAVVNDTGIFISIFAQAICATGPGIDATSVRSLGRIGAFERKVSALRATASSS